MTDESRGLKTGNDGEGVQALVVSGFLGAGKTTLVRHLLQDAQRMGQRMAVVSNEFGELGIDAALLKQNQGGDFVELEGGCVCCQLSNELLATLQGLWERVRPDRVIVETSGVALPFETLMTFWREPVVQWVEESFAVVVVNAEQLAEGRDLAGTFEQQVSSADLLLLNKIDLVPAAHHSRLQAALETMAPGTPVIPTVNGALEPSVLFPSNPAGRNRRKPTAGQAHIHESFDAEELTVPGGMDPERLLDHMRTLQALRLKGFVETNQGIRLLQGVGPRVDLVVPHATPPSELLNRVVVIRRSAGTTTSP